ncbi:MAG: hypothetical protein DRJ03_25080 [Chloroflexi bacterium]|nr:MAG: hypothetical protein DRJ03_25080 [Chloroflexota bacterium]
MENALVDGNHNASLLAEDADSCETARLRCKGRALVTVGGPLMLALQKVNDKYPWGDDFAYILAVGRNPSDLDGDDSLDCEEKTGITDTSETEQVNKIFVFADLRHYYVLPPRGGLVRAVVQAGIAVTNGTGSIYLTKMTFGLGYVDSAGSFTSGSTADATPNFYTNKVDYQLCSGQAWLDWNFDIPSGRMLALRVQLYGRVDSGVTGKMKLCCGRGSYDSYLEF